MSWHLTHNKPLPEALDYLSALSPDVVLWQGLEPKDLALIEDTVDVIGYPAARTAASLELACVFLRAHGPLVFHDRLCHPPAPHHPPAAIAARLRGEEGQLSTGKLLLVSEHGCPFSAENRLREAEWSTTLIARDRTSGLPGLCITGGNRHSYPEAEIPPDLAKTQDRVFYTQRTFPEGRRRYGDGRLDRTMQGAGYTDAARWASCNLDQYQALKPTTGFTPLQPHREAPSRTSRIYLSEELAQAITSVGTGRTDEVGHLSEHLPLLVTLSLPALQDLLAQRPAGDGAW
ncbi:hypothetical protein ACFWXK_24390 [Streptomyces sp. NPDC059070]|uniref:hypothetical protein n=1 Tax=Streptomyces sp. NPDC059070 TaxID=3346713 RepID=UPI0036B2C2A7